MSLLRPGERWDSAARRRNDATVAGCIQYRPEIAILLFLISNRFYIVFFFQNDFKVINLRYFILFMLKHVNFYDVNVFD